MVLSEYLNQYSRIEWNGNYKNKYPKFKHFRRSVDFQNMVSDAEAFARKILQFCKIHSLSPDALDINQALTGFASGQLDFNDALILDVCRKQNLKLMTNDADFLTGGIEVLTTNPQLLRACP